MSGAAVPLLLILTAAPAVSQTRAEIITWSREASTQPVIAEIRVERANVFDPAVPGEDWLPFRLADRIHIITRDSVVRDEILFQPGERWDPLKAIESERNLRGNYHFRKAEVRKVPRPDGRVDVVVLTQDSWTTNPSLDFGMSGGQSGSAFGLEEENLLGYGKSVAYTHSQSPSVSGTQTSDTYSYGDSRFLSTRLALAGEYTRTTQNKDSESISLSRPFYSLDTPVAMTASWRNSNSVGGLVQDGNTYSKYLEQHRVVDAAYGWRLKDDHRLVQRVECGWYEDKDSFHPTNEPPGTLPGAKPGDFHLSGPTVGYSWLQPRYVRETYIDRMERVEDFNLGNELHLRTGYMARGTGSDQDRWIFNASDRQGIDLGESRFILASVGFSGRLFNNRWENGLATTNINLFWQNYAWSRSRTLVAHLEAAQGRRLDLQNQIVLDGSNGLRGYKNNSFAGGRSILANLEDRFFFDGEYFHLARFGGVFFMESGSVVPEGSGFALTRFRSDVGAGLRAASTRSSSGSVVRLDLAYALNPSPGGSRWVVSIRGGQAFSFFNSASQRVDVSPPSQL